jgi:hypothetical protein
MKTTELASLFERDLLKVRTEVLSYTSDSDLWRLTPGISNSAGNLRHFIGHVLGGSSYIREREKEFSQKDLSREYLAAEIDTTVTEVIPVLKALSADRLDLEFPKEISGMKQTTGFALLHLFGHLSYHLGQMNYHRRMASGKG